jgi:hypothetical protein
VTTALPLIRWDAPGPYLAAFSTRLGGVSEAPFDTLNLGKLTADSPGHVAENRMRLCAETGTEPELLCFGRQMHGPLVRRAEGQGERGDGVWTDEPGKPLLVFTADCLPVALARANGSRPARTSPPPSASDTAHRSSVGASSISWMRPSRPCAPQESGRSPASTCARPATPTSSSRTGGTADKPADRA